MTPTRRRITSRQREVLRLASEGLTAREIGERIGRSPNTVKAHMAAAYDRLAVSNLLEALRALGWIRLT